MLGGKGMSLQIIQTFRRQQGNVIKKKTTFMSKKCDDLGEIDIFGKSQTTKDYTRRNRYPELLLSSK